MSSPIHSYLFSPPPSPPHHAVDGKLSPNPNRNLHSLKSLIPGDLIPRMGLESHVQRLSAGLGAELKPRSPRTPQQHHFTLDNAYPSAYPSNPHMELDPESTPRTPLYASPMATPRNKLRRSVHEKISSPPYLPTNVPSSPLPIPSTVPKPLIRLMFLASLILSSIVLLIFVPAARLPSLRAASISRRLALSPDGRAYVDLENTIGSWSESRDRDYQPPQIHAGRLLPRRAAPTDAPAYVSARPNTHPLPATHEILALQSYLLSSKHNVLPHDLDAQKPLDANAVLGVGYHHLGAVGSAKAQLWLDELEKEWESEVVVWYGGDGVTHHPHKLLEVLKSIHKSNHHPTLLPCHERPDLKTLREILLRHSPKLDITSSPLIAIGNKMFSATPENIEAMKNSGELETLLKSVGWVRDHALHDKRAKARKLKQATWRKRDESEVQRAIRKARR